MIADNWSEKACRRRTQGVGRMRYMKKVFRRFRYAAVTSYASDGMKTTNYTVATKNLPVCF